MKQPIKVGDWVKYKHDLGYSAVVWRVRSIEYDGLSFRGDDGDGSSKEDYSTDFIDDVEVAEAFLLRRNCIVRKIL